MLLCRSVALGQPRKIGEGSRFNSFTTNNYKLHFYETPSGIKARRSALQWAHGSTGQTAWDQHNAATGEWWLR